jgi:hypothetical protein
MTKQIMAQRQASLMRSFKIIKVMKNETTADKTKAMNVQVILIELKDEQLRNLKNCSAIHCSEYGGKED